MITTLYLNKEGTHQFEIKSPLRPVKGDHIFVDSFKKTISFVIIVTPELIAAKNGAFPENIDLIAYFE